MNKKYLTEDEIVEMGYEKCNDRCSGVFCDSPVLYAENGPHMEAICGTCGKHLRFVRKVK